jgi:hypothetical protein
MLEPSMVAPFVTRKLEQAFTLFAVNANTRLSASRKIVFFIKFY